MAAAQVTKRHFWLAGLPGQRKMLVAIVPLLCLFLLNSQFTLNGLYQQEQTRHLTEHTYKVMLAVGQAQQANQASVIAARGYVLSQDPAELGALASDHRLFTQSLDSMRALTADNPVQQARLDRLQVLVAQWETEVDKQLVTPLRSMQRTDPANSLMQRSRIRENYLARRTVGAPDINAVLRQITSTEQSLLAQRNRTL